MRIPIVLLVSILAAPPRDISMAQEPGSHALVTGKIQVGAIALPRAKIELMKASDAKVSTATITGPDGSFGFNNVPFGEWKIKVTQEGGTPKLYKVNVDSTAINISPISIPQEPNPTSQLRWSAYGYEDQPGSWGQLFFKPEKGGNDEPKEGDTVVAVGDSFARKDYLHFDVASNSWSSFPQDVGTIKKGQKVIVKKIAYPKAPSDTSESKYIWIGF